MDSTSNRGVKRKRYEPPEEELSIRIGGKLHHEIKEVHKACKRAKVFETQKVVKRLKDLRKKGEKDKAIREFEEELTSLKDIDHDAIGNSAFRSKVLKDHTLRDNEDIEIAMKNELENQLLIPAEPGTTLAKIQSRLLSSKVLAIQVAASLNTLKILLNPALKQGDKVTDSDVHAATSALDPPIAERPFKLQKEFTSKDLEPKNRSAKSMASPPGDEQERQSDVDDAGWESGSQDGDGAPEADDGWESGSIDGSDKNEGGSDSDEEGESGQDPDSDNEELKVVTQSKAPATKSAKGSSSKLESTFLPSLSVGFVRGSDESDWSEGEGKAADMPKKNRRGQRARRAIWEKKFGRNANHKKKEAEETAAAQLRRNTSHTSTINTGSNAIHARTMSVTRGSLGLNKALPSSKPTPQQHQPVDSGWGGRTGSISGGKSARPSASKYKQEDKPLHPSWEAKRRLKEKESVGIVPSKGTKIKFS